MKLEVRRGISGRPGTFGELHVDGGFFCYTLEPPMLDPPVKPRAIPAGTYPLTITHSDRFGRDMPLVDDVPGFEGIRIHVGNTVVDTVGCLLVGAALDLKNGYLSRSKVTFDDLFEKLKGGLPATITYVDPQ